MSEIIRNFFNLEVLRRSSTLLLSGLRHTITLVVFAFLIALVLGGAVAYGRTDKRRVIRTMTRWYIDLIRALPPLVTLMLITYLLPALFGFTLTSSRAAIITFGLIHAAYVGEIYRGGIISIDQGQIEAARSVGLSGLQTARLVLMPQVVRIVLPPLTNEATFVVRNSSLAFFIGYPELLLQAKQAVTLTTNSTPLTAATFAYAVMILIMQGISVVLERRFHSSALEPKVRKRNILGSSTKDELARDLSA